MIEINVKEIGSIDKALKLYKRKNEKMGTVKALRDRKEFEKKSVTRRKEVSKAKYIQKKKSSE